MVMISEVPFYSQRPFVHMTLGGVFERFPRLKFVMTEMGAAWIPPLLKQLDGIIANVKKGEIGELKYTDGERAGALGHRVLQPELLGGREPAGPGRRRRPRR